MVSLVQQVRAFSTTSWIRMNSLSLSWVILSLYWRHLVEFLGNRWPMKWGCRNGFRFNL